MKILQVNCVYNKGSTGKIVHDIHSGLISSGIDSVVCYGRGQYIQENGVYKTSKEWYSKFNNGFSRIKGTFYDGCFFSTNNLIKIIKDEKPNIVHLHCINGFFVNIYRLLDWLKKNHIKTVLTLHAEFMYTGGCGYSYECNQWKKINGCGNPACPKYKTELKSIFFDRTNYMWKRMYESFQGFDKSNLLILSVSPWIMERAKQSPILSSYHHEVLLNGVDTNIFCPSFCDDLKKKHGITDEKVLLHVSPNFNLNENNNKGGYHIFNLAQQLKDCNIKIIVIGPYDHNIKPLDNMIIIGSVTNQKELAKYYSLADVTILTSKKETFSMVTAESLCCGTPIVGFKAGGPEKIAIPEYSCFVDYGDIIALKNKIMDFIIFPKDSRIPKTAAQKYSKDNMVKKLILCYEKMI